MRKLIPAALFLLAPLLAVLPGPAQAATCTVGLGGVCGAYDDPGITWSNGFNTYVTDQDVGCGGNTSLCNDTLTATGPGDWTLTSDMNDSAAGCNQVHTYPDVQQLTQHADGTSVSLAGYKALYSSFTIHSPPAGSWEAAYDLWTSGRGSGEVMIWVNTRNHDHGEVLSGTPKISGQRFHVYTSGDKASPGEIIVKLDADEDTGTVHIRATLNWLIRHGWLPQALRISQINFGWEVCGTGGIPQDFRVTSYTLTGTT